MRSIALAIILLLGAATAAEAQSSSAGDIGLTYHWIRTNATPGNCGCFGMNGGGLSGSWNFSRRLAAVLEVSSENATAVFGSGKSLTVTSFMAGGRYRFRQFRPNSSHGLQPFAQFLVGAAHAGGGIAGIADHTYAFAVRVGGGIDLPLDSVIALRLAQVDYSYTNFSNRADDHQNNLLLAAGLVIHW